MVERELQARQPGVENYASCKYSPLEVARLINYSNGTYDGYPSASDAVFKRVPSLRHKSIEFASGFVNTVVDILHRHDIDIRS